MRLRRAFNASKAPFVASGIERWFFPLTTEPRVESGVTSDRGNTREQKRFPRMGNAATCACSTRYPSKTGNTCLTHDVTELLQVIGIMRQAQNKAANRVEVARTRERGIADIQVGL